MGGKRPGACLTVTYTLPHLKRIPIPSPPSPPRPPPDRLLAGWERGDDVRDGRWGLGGMASGPGRGEVLVPEEIDVGLHLPHPPPPPPPTRADWRWWVGARRELRRALEWGWEWWQASATGPRNALEFSEKGGTSVTARFEGLKKGRRGRLFPVSFGEHAVSSRCGRHADFELSECRIGPLRPAIARREA